jgi:hypothetical protein
MRLPSFIMIFCLIATLEWASAESEKNSIHKGEEPLPPSGILQFKTNNQKTMETVNASNRITEGFFRLEDSFRNLQIGKSMAQEMALLIRNQELADAFSKITLKKNKELKENPALAAPFMIITGAATFWFGKTINVFKSDVFQMSARIEGQTRQSEFSMSSPLMNGKLNFNENTGTSMGVGRRISSLNANAYINYNFREKAVNTEFRQKISPNIDFSFGVGKYDQNTKIEYRFNF